eukprot:3333100-Pyramimonas_sp.AAC.1
MCIRDSLKPCPLIGPLLKPCPLIGPPRSTPRIGREWALVGPLFRNDPTVQVGCVGYTCRVCSLFNCDFLSAKHSQLPLSRSLSGSTGSTACFCVWRAGASSLSCREGVNASQPTRPR